MKILIKARLGCVFLVALGMAGKPLILIILGLHSGIGSVLTVS